MSKLLNNIDKIISKSKTNKQLNIEDEIRKAENENAENKEYILEKINNEMTDIDNDKSRKVAFKLKYRDDITGFVKDCISIGYGKSIYKHQERVLNEFIQYKKVAVMGPHGLGKTAMISWIVLWGVLVFDNVKIVTTANGQQLRAFLWPEINKWAGKLIWKNIPYKRFTSQELGVLRISIRRSDKTASAVALISSDTGAIEGAHEDNIIYLLDEAKLIPDSVWLAVEGAFTNQDTIGRKCFAFAVSTPGKREGIFYQIQSDQKTLNWKKIHVTLDECIESGAISKKLAEEKREELGEYQYAIRFLGIYPDREDDLQIIHNSDLNKCFDNYEKFINSENPNLTVESIGVDIAQGNKNSNKTLMCIANKDGILDWIEIHNTKTIDLPDIIINEYMKYNSPNLIVDIMNIGEPVFLLIEKKFDELGLNKSKLIPFSGSWGEDKYQNPSNIVKYQNLRAAAISYFAEKIGSTNFFINNNPFYKNRIVSEFTIPYKTFKGNKIGIISKRQLRIDGDIKGSTDYFDSAYMAVSAPVIMKQKVIDFDIMFMEK